jgi:hypothetical protein
MRVFDAPWPVPRFAHSPLVAPANSAASAE